MFTTFLDHMDMELEFVIPFYVMTRAAFIAVINYRSRAFALL